VHPDLDCNSWAPGFVRGEFVEVLHGFHGDSDDLFGRLVDPDADPADVPQRRGDAGAMSAEAFGPSDRAVTIAAISKVLDQRYVCRKWCRSWWAGRMRGFADWALRRHRSQLSLSWSVLAYERPGMTRIWTYVSSRLR
jgi:hypothetical protein